jgi:hypothetical protein
MKRTGWLSIRMFAIAALALCLQILSVFAARSSYPQAPAPAASVTSIDARTGVVTAKVNASGQPFQFTLSNAAQVKTLRIGQAVYANFAAKQVSLDGQHVAGQIISVGPASKAAGAASAQSVPSLGKTPPAACCVIAALANEAGVVTGKVNATGAQFQFTLSDAAALRSLQIGEPVYANFNGHQVSLDGQHIAGQIINGPSGDPVTSGYEISNNASAATAATAPAKGAGNMPTQPAQAPAPAKVPQASSPAAALPGTLNAPAQKGKSEAPPLPTLVLGTPQPVTQQLRNAKSIPFVRLAPSPNPTLVHLHGLDGIKSASGLPDGVQDFLFLHARQLPPGEVDNYIVNVELAQQWFKDNPEPPFVKQAAQKAMSSGCGSTEHCNAISVHCAEQAAAHAQCEANRQVENIRKAWEDEWHHISGQAEQQWHKYAGCLVDQTLNPGNAAFQFSVTPQFPVSFQKSGNTSNSYGTFSGQISGTATVGVPLNGSFTGQLKVSYIPCLPFAVRPKSIAGDGTLGVGATLDATLNASGQFEQSVTVPPNGIKIPVYVIPVVIGGVPVAELDASVYLDGTLKVDGKGTLNGHARLEAHEEAAYNFACNGAGCTANAHRMSVPDTATESVQVQGRIHLRPAVYAAVQLDLDWDILSARSGPEPYLLGELFGCEYAAGSQSTASAAASQENHALAADVDWGVVLRSEALAGGKEFWHHDWNIPGPDGKPLGGHLLFKPLAPSNALIPALAGVAQPQTNEAAAYNVKMPQCYPYSDQIEYMVQWNGGATESGLSAAPAGGSPSNARRSSPIALAANRPQPPTSSPAANCTLQSGQADCWADPLKDLPFSLDWAAPGNYSVVITPVSDKHGRKFDSGSASQLNVNVQ